MLALLTVMVVVVAACSGTASTSSATPPAVASSSSSSEGSASLTSPADLGEGISVPVPVAGQPPVAGVPWYLAVGDSVTSGFTFDPSRAGVNSSWALQLQGMLAQRGEPWQLYDTACSGERTDTYYTHCSGSDETPFLAHQSQHDAALAAVRAHKADLKLILVDLGSNDLLRALRRGQNPLTAAATLQASLGRIVAELVHAAPGVPVVVANYYDPLANLFPATQPLLQKVNDMVKSVAVANHARLADFYSAINTVTNGIDPHLCDYVDCAHTDVHPTIAGHTRLAEAALAEIP
jgi:lysophospholipase L1-like esterase